MSKPQSMLYQNSQHTRVMNLKYKGKYKRLKRQIKNLVFDNASLCDEVAEVQTELTLAREERRFLIKRLIKREGLVAGGGEREAQLQQLPPNGATPTVAAAAAVAKVPHVPKKRGPKKRIAAVAGGDGSVAIGQKSGGTTITMDKSRKARDKVTLDASGKPKFPINLSNILIHSPGEIIPINPNFHTAHWIYPVGYVATRIYAHPKDPQRKCVFTCKILNNAGMPQFQIIPDNDLDSVFFGETANVCHHGLVEALQRALSDVVKLPLHVQGEKFFGLANPTVKTLMRMDPGFKQCANFRGFTSQEGIGDFTLGEDKDPTMSFEALQSLIAMSAYHTMPEVKEEPPDELLDFN